MPFENKVDAVIASGASLSSEINLSGSRLFAINMPASWTTANLTFQGSDRGGGTYNNIYDENGNELTVTAAASQFIILEPLKFLGLRNLKIRSGTSGLAVNQGADRAITLVCLGE